MSNPLLAVNAPLLSQEAPHKFYRNAKVQAFFAAMLVGFGLVCVVMQSGQTPASDIDMAALGSMNGLRLPIPRTQAFNPMQPAKAQQPMCGISGTPPRVLLPPGQSVASAFAARNMMAMAEPPKDGPVVTILGATGLVGQELLELLPRAWPNCKLQLFASSDKTLEVKGKKYEISAASKLEGPDAPKGDIAFVALDDAFSAKYCPILLDLGYRVIDKSNTYRQDPNVPLVVPGVNSDLVTDDVRLVANPNCNTIPFCLAVAPLQRKYGLKGATVSSYQAVSGAGIGPLDEFLEKSKKGYAEANRIGTQWDPAAYAGNIVPHNGGTDDSGFSSEERKLVFESRKILRLPDFDVSAQCCRVPVAVSHYENAWVTFGEKVTPEMAMKVLTDKKQAPFLQVKDGPVGEGISSIAALQNRDDTLAGRMRNDPRDASGATLCMTVTADNIRQGAATNAVRVASCWYPSKDENLQAKCFPPP